ncbi:MULTISPECIES: 7-cyano-7-deazaguanine synthase [Luteibacter]|uniref:7-cyano-7-deazaguanine synthase n=1 Tax=Luteibacter TaxID=242605 RepID=UPI00056CD0A0|nr:MULTISPECIES: 7-cyano-7-deazaguanine synthase [unclassified Luteibacter]
MTAGLLLSGGMDSAALAWWKRPDVAFTIDYGQLAAQAELRASAAICESLSIPHVPIQVDCRALGSGDMAGDLPDAHAPCTDWWPYRNQLLITLAGMRAISLGVDTLMIGTVASDGTHADGRIEFFENLDALMACQEGGLRVTAPAIELTTVNLIRAGGIPASLLAWAHSCHKANVACGQCRGCNKYFEVYHELGYDLAATGYAAAAG